ncbi:MAG: hypothetical protein ACM3JB_16440 [Acidobacteriaceae bacterium]
MKRPLTVTLIALLLLLSGVAGIAYHITDVKTWHPFSYEYVAILLIRVLAILAGIYMLRGHDWARWVALLWITFHLVISFFNSWSQVAVHSVVLAIFAYVLLRPAATAYFRPQTTASS